MSDYVVDTNIWVMIDKPIEELNLVEIGCVKTCRNWLKEFFANLDRLVIDDSYRILKEYRRSISRGGRAAELLSQLETQPKEQLVPVQIEFEGDVAILPFEIADPNDRKFVAVALAHKPTPPIVDATDTDWARDKHILENKGIIVQELCPDYIQQKLK